MNSIRKTDQLLQFRRELRQQMTDSERLLWAVLRGRRLDELKFRRQHPVGDYIVDFICLEQKLVIELDGGYHEAVAEQDLRRQAWIESQGFAVLRSWNEDVLNDVEVVVRSIRNHIGTSGYGLKDEDCR